MGIEDDLFEALKYASFGGMKGSPPVGGMLKVLMNTVEINVLRKMQVDLANMQETLGKRISELSKQKPSSGLGKDMDPFNILGVRPDSTEAEVKKAYKGKAARAHPDRGGSNEDMVMVNAAYEAIRRYRGWT